MTELPLDLQQLETVGGAFDILVYLDDQADKAADGDDIMDHLGLSSRRFDKAKRRLVTRGYIQMRSDYYYELTPKGSDSAAILKEHNSASGTDDENILERQLVLILPRNLVLGQTSPLQVGIEPNSAFNNDVSTIIRIQTTYADLGDYNEMATLGPGHLLLNTTITPQNYDHARIKVEVYTISDGGDDLAACGGMYVDIVVVDAGSTGASIAYGTNLAFPQT